MICLFRFYLLYVHLLWTFFCWAHCALGLARDNVTQKCPQFLIFLKYSPGNAMLMKTPKHPFKWRYDRLQNSHNETVSFDQILFIAFVWQFWWGKTMFQISKRSDHHLWHHTQTHRHTHTCNFGTRVQTNFSKTTILVWGKQKRNPQNQFKSQTHYSDSDQLTKITQHQEEQFLTMNSWR